MPAQEDLDRIEPVVGSDSEDDTWIVPPPEASYNAGTAPPSYRSIYPAPRPVPRLFPVYGALEPPPPPPPPRPPLPPPVPRERGPRQSRSQPAISTTFFIFLLLTHSTALALCAIGLGQLPNNGSVTHLGLVAALAATIAEMVCIFVLGPILFYAARGVSFAALYALLAVGALGTNCFLLHGVTLDKRDGLCGVLSRTDGEECRNGLSAAVGTGCFRLIVVLPCYIAVFVRAWWPQAR